MKKWFFIIGFILLITVVGFQHRVSLKNVWFEWNKETVPKALSLSDIQDQKHQEVKLHEPDVLKIEDQPDLKEEIVIPDEFNLDMQFYSQAPYANWDLPYQEACEEASLLLAMNYIRGLKVLKDEFNKELLEIVEFEKEHFGDYLHTNVEETGEIIEVFYNHPEISILQDPTVEDIKAQIAQGYPVLVPLAGQLIGNPFYAPPGPVYHFLVIKGYTKTHFITHDVGTRRGEDYVYPFKVLINNIHDWAEPIISGENKVLVVGA